MSRFYKTPFAPFFFYSTSETFPFEIASYVNACESILLHKSSKYLRAKEIDIICHPSYESAQRIEDIYNILQIFIDFRTHCLNIFKRHCSLFIFVGKINFTIFGKGAKIPKHQGIRFEFWPLNFPREFSKCFPNYRLKLNKSLLGNFAIKAVFALCLVRRSTFLNVPF